MDLLYGDIEYGYMLIEASLVTNTQKGNSCYQWTVTAPTWTYEETH